MDIVKLRELLEGELSSPYLTELDEEFYREFDSLIKALKMGAESSHERGEDVEERLYLAQLSIAERLMKEIIKIRLHKIVDLAVEGTIGDLTEEEKKIFTVLRAFVEREEIVLPEDLSEIELPEPQPETEFELLKRAPIGEAYIVLIDIPKIMGTDMREYGPFRAGDLAVLPREIARILQDRNAAERVRITP
ncbi:DNA replication complex subunit Gins51 [Thermococcus sp.]